MAKHTNTTIVATSELERLLATGILSNERVFDPLFPAGVSRALILVRDLLREADRQGERVSVTDDVHLVGETGDLTDLIARCRNAACHSDSALHEFGEAIVTWNFAMGAGRGVRVGGGLQASEYDDDLAICFGAMRLYLRHNLLRAIEEARQRFGPVDLA